MSDRRAMPVSPTVFPVLFFSCLALLAAAYVILEKLGYPPGYALLFGPLLLPLLPAEIKYAMTRRKVSQNILTDFVSRGIEVDTDYDRILAGMRCKGLTPQTVITDSDDSQGPLSWR